MEPALCPNPTPNIFIPKGAPPMTDHAAIIESTVREQLAGAHIAEVRVAEGEDYEGHPIFDVMVVYDGAQPDVRQMSGLPRHTRAKLRAIHEPRFPIFSFVSRPDAEELDAEIA